MSEPLVRIIYEQQGHHRIIILEEKRRRKKNQERSKLRLFQHKYFRVVYVAAKDQGIYVRNWGAKSKATRSAQHKNTTSGEIQIYVSIIKIA